MTQDALFLDTAGRKISDFRLERGLRINILAGILGVSFYAAAQGTPLTMFMEALGSSGVLMGMALTALQGAVVLQIVGALLADRLAARKPVWAAFIILSRGLWFLPILFVTAFSGRPDLIAKAVFWLIVVSAALGQCMTALWFSWMADLVPERMLGRFWGRRQSYVMVSFLVATAVVGWVLDTFPTPQKGGNWFGFIFVFAVGSALGVADIVIHLWVPEPRMQKEEIRVPWLARIVEPLANANFRRLSFAMGAYAFAVGLVSLGIVYLKRDFRVSYSHLAVLTISSSLGVVLFSIIWGYVLDRIGGRAFTAIMLALGPVLGLTWFFVKDYSTDILGLCRGIPVLGAAVHAIVGALPHRWQAAVSALVLPQPIWLHLFATFFAGAIFGGIGLGQVNMASALSPRNGRTMAMAIHWSLVGLIGSAGSVLAGYVMDFFVVHPVAYVFPTGARFSFFHVLIVLHMAVLWFVALPLLLRVRRRQGEPHLRTAFSQLLVTSPVRVVTSIYVMGAAVTSERRARAVRNLGNRRNAIAVGDLIERMDDPSPEVREEAALALGSIGSPEAVSALLTRLSAPESDLAPQIARALRMAGNPAGVEALIRELADPDRETRVECARALGSIQDHRAVEPLRALLRETGDPKVLSAAAGALARIGDPSALADVADRELAMAIPVIKRTLAVAVGDLLGVRGEFYRILIAEQRVRGSQVEKLAREICRDVRGALGRSARDAGSALCADVQKARALYDEEQFVACARVLYEVAVRIAEARWQVRPAGDTAGFVEGIRVLDPVFGAGLRHLDLLRRQTGNLVSVDLLPAFYFLSANGPRE